MYKNALVQLVIVLFLFGLVVSLRPLANNTKQIREIISCGPGTYYSLDDLPRIKHPRLIYPDDESDFPRVVANDNTVAAGTMGFCGLFICRAQQ